jgi:hypothetical protein
MVDNDCAAGTGGGFLQRVHDRRASVNRAELLDQEC